MVNWEDKEIKTWKEDALKRQQHFCDSLGEREYDYYTCDQLDLFELKIAFSYFGPPIVEEDKKDFPDGHILDYYEEKKRKFVREIKGKIINAVGSQDIYAAFLFVITQQHKITYLKPLIRIKKNDTDVLYVDDVLRIYSSWNDYLENNALPECICCFPKDGYYRNDDSGKVKHQFDTSPRCKLSGRAANVADKAANMVTIGSLVLLGGSFFFLPLAPIAAVAEAGAVGYTMARKMYEIFDRAKHDQSINPFKDSAARGAWLGVVGGALGLGSTGVNSYISSLATRGEIAKRFMRTTCTVLSAGNLTLNGLGVVSNIIELLDKKEGEDITKTEIVNFIVSVLFFTNTLMSFKTAKSLIREVQMNVIDNHGKNLSKETAEAFKALRNKAVLNTKVGPNTKLIKRLKRIDNTKEFWICLAIAGDTQSDSDDD